jgi:hypothetical protein
MRRSGSREGRLAPRAAGGWGAAAAAGPALVGGLLLYLVAPGHPLGLLTGLPLGMVSLAAVGVLACALFGLGLPPPSRRAAVLAGIVLAATTLKVLLWSVAPTYGLAATYYARARLTGAPERSTDFRTAPYTRVEQVPGAPLNLHFFNDVERFNHYEGNGPERTTLPFAARWDGLLHVPADGQYTFSLAASGEAALILSERPILTVAARNGPTGDRVTVPLAAGAQPVRLQLVHAGGTRPSLGLESDLGGSVAPLGPPHLTVSGDAGIAPAGDAPLALAARALDAVVLALLAGVVGMLAAGRLGAWRAAPAGARAGLLERPALALVVLAVLVHALWTTADLYRRTVILEGGQDWLTYESYARDILLNGPLMTLGEPLGKGKPFFFQPFYPYSLALVHALTGEDLWGPVALQLVGLGAAGVVLYYLAKRLFGAPAAVATLGLYLVLRASQLDWVARKLLSENLYFVVLPAAILLLVRYADEGRRRDLVWSGLFFGIASITRAPTLLYVPIAAWIVVLLLRRRGVAWRPALASFVLLGLVTGAVASLVPLRNYVVSGRPALVASNGGATLLLAHTPTDKVRLSGIDRNPVYNWLKLDRQTREVVEFVRQDPAGYALTLVPLGLYAIGIPNGIEGAGLVAPDILAITVLYVLALVLLPGARSLRVAPLHAFVALHLAIMMTFLPYVYGYRQVLPMQLLMLVFCGALVAHLARGAFGMRVAGRAPSPPLVEERAG